MKQEEIKRAAIYVIETSTDYNMLVLAYRILKVACGLDGITNEIVV